MGPLHIQVYLKYAEAAIPYTHKKSYFLSFRTLLFLVNNTGDITE